MKQICCRALTAVVLICGLSFAAAAQQPTVSETVEVRLLEVDVVVTDSAGKPVQGLTASDFELFENGRVQPVTNVSEFREKDEAPAAVATVETKPSATTLVTQPEPRTLVFLLDPIPLQGARRVALFESLRALVEKLRPEDQVQILTWAGTGFRLNIDVGAPRTSVLAKLRTMGNSPTAAIPEGISIDQKEVFLRAAAEISDVEYNPEELEVEKRNRADEELAAMRRKTASMQRIVSSLTDSGGRTAVLYVSSQFSRIAGKRAFLGSRSAGGPPSPDEMGYDTTRMIEAVIASANANGVAFYALHPAVPSTVGQIRSLEEEALVYLHEAGKSEVVTDFLLLQNELQALSQLAERTGGTVSSGSAGVRQVIERITSDLSSYYSLGWRARSDGSDRERRVLVKTKNPAYAVRARSAIVEKSDRTRAEDLLVARLFERGGSGDLEFEVKVSEPTDPRKKSNLIPVELTIPVDQLKFVSDGGESAARFTVLTVAGASIGQTTKITRDTRRVTGSAQADGVIHYDFTVLANLKGNAISVGVFDENSGLIGVRTINLDASGGTVAAEQSSTADAVWRDALDRSIREHKPLVVFFRPKRCKPCDVFERESVAHPAIERRIPQVVFASVPLTSETASALWQSKESGLAVVDETATIRGRWMGVRDTTELGAIIDAAIASAANFQRAAEMVSAAGPYAGATEAAIGLMKLGKQKEARELLDDAVAKGDPISQQLAEVSRATLTARDGRADEALATLARISSDARNGQVAAEAWLATGLVHRLGGANDAARRAFRMAVEIAQPGSTTRGAAESQLAGLATTAAPLAGVISIVPFRSQIVTGRQTVRTTVTSPSVARVTFTLDGKETASVSRPPFSTDLQFAKIPQASTIRAVAFDTAGAEIGRHELTVNDGGEIFWLRVTEPASGEASGRIAVSIDLRAPATRNVKKITLSWNDAPAATLTNAPWRSIVEIPSEVGVLRAVAELDDGRTAEDAVVLNTGGYVERAEVQLVEFPMTLTPTSTFAASDITVTEGGRKRTVESVTTGSESPLTVGMLIDTSASMQQRLPDLQEAAIRFLESTISTSDRAFVIAFDSHARLLEAPTSDRAALRRRIMALMPQGSTAIYDAMILGLLQFEGVKGRRALVVFTDGLDHRSRYTADELRELSRRSNVPIYLVTPPLPTVQTTEAPISLPTNTTAVPNTRRGEAPRQQVTVKKVDPRAEPLFEVARSSGGQLFEMTKFEALQSIYDTIAEALAAQALVTIRTDPASKENEWRAIDVEIAKRGVEIRAPAGYYVPR